VTGFDGFAEEGLGVAEEVGDATRVGADRVVDLVPGEFGGGLQNGFDGFDEAVDVTRSVAAGDRGAHCAAFGVTDDDNKTDVQVLDGVLDAAEHMIVEDVAGVAQDEQIAEPLVEVELRGEARIGAREDDGKRRLAVGEGGAAGDGLVGMGRCAADKTPVAFELSGERLVRAHGLLGAERARSAKRSERSKGKGEII